MEKDNINASFEFDDDEKKGIQENMSNSKRKRR